MEENSKIVNRHCPACETDNSALPRHPDSPQEWPMKTCGACNFTYLEKAWSLDMLFEEFDWGKSVTKENKRRDEMRGIERKLSKRFRRLRNRMLPRNNAAKLAARYSKAGNILDVGSGSGYHLLQLPPQCVPYGIEISTEAVNAGRENIISRGGQLVNFDALTGMKSFGDNFFNGIIMRSFLEHDSCPKEVLHEAHRVLAPGGIVVIKVPNWNSWNRLVMGKKWCGYRFPEHVNYFTPKTLTNLLLRNGYYIERFNFFDRIATSDNMWLIAKKG